MNTVNIVVYIVDVIDFSLGFQSSVLLLFYCFAIVTGSYCARY